MTVITRRVRLPALLSMDIDTTQNAVYEAGSLGVSRVSHTIGPVHPQSGEIADQFTWGRTGPFSL